MAQTTDVELAVVGGGLAGLAAARALRRAGRAPVVFEQFGAVHARGSSHGASRIFRLSCPEPEWVTLAREALAGWRRLEAETGVELVRTTGSLDAGAHVESHARALHAAGEAAELLDGEACERRFGVRLPAGAAVLHQPDGGVVLADRALSVLRADTHLAERTRVEALEPDGDGIVLVTARGRVRARAAIVAAGAWAPRLLARAGIALDVRVTRETVAYADHPDPDRLPPLIEQAHPDWPSPARLAYALPDPGRGLKAGLHHAGPAADPDEPGEPDARAAAWAAAWAAERFPGAAEPHAVETCLYTTTPDERFVLERHGRIVVGSACSGHGFKFGPAVGARLAALALEALEA